MCTYSQIEVLRVNVAMIHKAEIYNVCFLKCCDMGYSNTGPTEDLAVHNHAPKGLHM